MKDKRTILLIDDDTVDVMTVKRSFKELGYSVVFMVAGDGEQALELLEAAGEALPSLILLDLNMPRMNGIELLEHLKTNQRYRKIPVIVLTTSNDESDRFRTFQHSIAGYMVKPVEYVKYKQLLATIGEYWSTSMLPPGLV